MPRQSAIDLQPKQPAPSNGHGLLRIVSPDALTRMESDKENERQNSEQQNKPFITSLAADLQTKWQAAVNARTTEMDERLLRCRRQRNGVYDPDTLAKIRKAGGADVFMQLTSVKCRAAAAWVTDVVLQPGEKPFSIEPTPVPDIPPDQESEITEEVLQETIAMMQARSIAGVTVQQVSDRMQELLAKVQAEKVESAKLSASRFEALVHDELSEGGFYSALAAVIEDLVTYPTAYMCGPEVRKTKKLTWSQDADGNYVPKVVDKLVRQYRRVSPFDIYPSPRARNIQDGYLFERALFSRSSLSRMMGVPGFSDIAIRSVLRDYGEKGFRYYLNTDQERADLESRPQEDNDPSPGIEALIYWGEVQGRKLLEWGIKKESIPDPDMDYQVCVWIIDNTVIGARLNSHPLGRRPYHATSYEMVADSVNGKSPVELMRDVQRICNALARAIVNNAALASGPQVEINKDRVDPDEDLEGLWAWKIWKTKDDVAGHGQPAIQFFQPQVILEALLRVYQYFFDQASEHTGIPAYIYGNDEIGGAGKTASGLSMLMNAASKTLKAVIIHLDENIIRPVVKDHWMMIMLYDDVPFKSGDINVIARASEYLIVQEQLQIRRQEFLRETNNPVDVSIIGMAGRAEVLREVAKGLKLGGKVVPSKEDLEAAQQQQQDAIEGVAGGEVPETPGNAQAAGMAGHGKRTSAIPMRRESPGGGRPGEATRMRKAA